MFDTYRNLKIKKVSTFNEMRNEVMYQDKRTTCGSMAFRLEVIISVNSHYFTRYIFDTAFGNEEFDW